MYMAPALTTSLAGQSKTTIVMTIVIAAIVATFGYRLSQRNRQTRGVTPWRIPSVVWAIICFFFAPFGIALELIAIISTRPDGRKLRSTKIADARVPATYPSTRPGPAPVEHPIAAYRPRIPASGFAPPATDVTGKPALFGWYPDAAGRHQLRYWDGRDWTGYVADEGRVGDDPLHPIAGPTID